MAMTDRHAGFRPEGGRASLRGMAQHRPPCDSVLPGPPASPAAKRSDDRPPEPVEAAHAAAVRDGLDQVRRREFASDAEIAALYRRAGL